MRGFSLVELSILLAVIGILLASLLPSQEAGEELRASEQTFDHAEQILHGLRVYYQEHGALPCPADITTPLNQSGSDFFGTAATFDATDGCRPASGVQANEQTDGATLPERVAFGAVPIRALGLPDEEALDGWNRRFSYHVSLATVQDGSDGVIQLNDSTGTAELTDGAVALVSHGPNGHGAYLPSGARYRSGSVNAGEQENCDCDENASENGSPKDYETRGNVIVRSFHVSGTSADNYFDDVVFVWTAATIADNAGAALPSP